MSTTPRGPGHEHDHSILASSRPEPAAQPCRGSATATDGPGLSGITRDGGERRQAGTGRLPGSVLIAVAAWLLALTGGGARRRAGPSRPGLQAGTARSYLYAELDDKKS